MPKRILVESFAHQTATAATLISSDPSVHLAIDTWQFSQNGPGEVEVRWVLPVPGGLRFKIDSSRFYLRGDNETSRKKQVLEQFVFNGDRHMESNSDHFKGIARAIMTASGLPKELHTPSQGPEFTEEEFHDQWAASVEVDKIDVIGMNEACTSPEMRHIIEKLGEVRGKSLLDIGCGLGEASVYFALKGAEVTALDISSGMLRATEKLAHGNGVSVKVVHSGAETLALDQNRMFDIIYIGNLLHHADIDATLSIAKRHLKPGGVFVSWDPVAYNPAINYYRRLASSVRTPDEHPLRVADLRTFGKHFRNVQTRYFWLTTLGIFIWMALIQKRNPNQERYWKSVVQEARSWEKVYYLLEFLDRIILAVFPPLRLWCWNVVLICRDPR